MSQPNTASRRLLHDRPDEHRGMPRQHRSNATTRCWRCCRSGSWCFPERAFRTTSPTRQRSSAFRFGSSGAAARERCLLPGIAIDPDWSVTIVIPLARIVRKHRTAPDRAPSRSCHLFPPKTKTDPKRPFRSRISHSESSPSRLVERQTRPVLLASVQCAG